MNQQDSLLHFFIELPIISAKIFITKVRIIKIAAMPKATPNSPLSLAYTYKATVKVAPELIKPSLKLFKLWATPAVNNRAALSPTILPIVRIQPVTMPSIQPGSTTVLITRHLPAPRPKAPSR